MLPDCMMNETSTVIKILPEVMNCIFSCGTMLEDAEKVTKGACFYPCNVP